MIRGAREATTKNRLAASWTLAGTLDDHCQLALKRLGWPGHDGKHAIRTLGVTSCRVGEGVSTVAAHLATAAAARQDGKVVLVDANLSRPAATRIFGVPNSPGLVECVLRDELVADALYPSTMENLYVLPAGEIHGSPARVFDAENLLDVVADLANHAALTIFDLPPARQASCVNRLSSALDGIILVVEGESVSWEMALRVKEDLLRAGAKIVGAILNKQPEPA
jgi:capsular exopolysaccharide synthesis family protein